MSDTIYLENFTVKATPVLADLIYLGDSANSFNERKATISAILATAIPAAAGTGQLFVSTGATQLGAWTSAIDSITLNSITAPIVRSASLTDYTVTMNFAITGAHRIYTVPEAGNDASFVMTQGNQTLAGTKTFSSAIAITATSNHIVLSTATNTATISAVNQSSGTFVYSIPNAGANANFVMTEGSNVTINGTKTFSADLRVFRSDPGVDVIFLVENNSTSTGSNSIINNYINNSGTGDAVYRCGHQSAQHYSWGYDNTDSDSFVIAVGDVLGTNNAFRINTSAQCSFPQNATFNGVTTTQTAASSGGTVSSLIINSSNTASSNALLGIEVGGTSAADPYILFSIPSGTSYTLGNDNSDSDAFVLSVGTALGTANALRCDSSGRFNYATQPRFWAYKSSSTTNATGDGTAITIIQDTEVYDVGSWFDNTTGIATAPVTGTYVFGGAVYYGALGAAHTSCSADFVVNSTSYTIGLMNPGVQRDGGNSLAYGRIREINLTAGDTVKINTTVSGSTKTVSNAGNSARTNEFWGMLVA